MVTPITKIMRTNTLNLSKNKKRGAKSPYLSRPAKII
jgi:hypothetical protein